MTSDEGMVWAQEARDALEQVAYRINENYDVSVEELQGLPNYERIPAEVRRTIEDVTSPDERRLLGKVFKTLGENQEYLGINLGGILAY